MELFYSRLHAFAHFAILGDGEKLTVHDNDVDDDDQSGKMGSTKKTAHVNSFLIFFLSFGCVLGSFMPFEYQITSIITVSPIW